MRFARVVFGIAGIWGILILTPLYFMFDVIGRQDPPAITHPGFYYGFVGVGLAWQFAFLVIAQDPVRFRIMMLPSVLEKFGKTIAETKRRAAYPLRQTPGPRDECAAANTV